ncbi:MAG TPA: TlyA family RNA methyltransferase [Terriglobia bacterium]|nr:TlyA family RNA methyltransferase [Terriglobia bacterium]
MPRLSSPKIRIDRLLAERGLAKSRVEAQALILAGQILVNEQKVDKCGTLVERSAEIRILGGKPPYASRAGRKLEAALDYFKIDPGGKICLDIGASTGGFTDCLLSRGAAKIYAVDAGTNQMDWRVRQNPRVVALEKTNARYLRFEQIGMKVDFVTMDVSFISSTLILPVLPEILEPGAAALILVKPQFEASREKIGKGGVVRDPGVHQEAVQKVSRKLSELNFEVQGSVESALPGAEGNREFFVYALWR